MVTTWIILRQCSKRSVYVYQTFHWASRHVTSWFQVGSSNLVSRLLIINLRREHQTRMIHAIFGYVSLKLEVTRKKIIFNVTEQMKKQAAFYHDSVQNVPSPTIKHFIEQVVLSLLGSRLAHQIWFHFFSSSTFAGNTKQGWFMPSLVMFP